MTKLTGSCIIGQSGGPTAVINASAQGVIQTALKADCITRVLGAAHGIKGVLDDKLYDMSQEDPAELDLLQYTPSSALGSCRYKLADPDVDDTDRCSWCAASPGCSARPAHPLCPGRRGACQSCAAAARGRGAG